MEDGAEGGSRKKDEGGMEDVEVGLMMSQKGVAKVVPTVVWGGNR